MPAFRSSITRPLDLERFTDRWALGSLFVFGGAGYMRGGWAEAVQAGLASYLAWALSREIDPDHPATATLAASAGGFSALALHTDIGVLFVMLLVTKVMVGGSGRSPARWEAGLLGAGALMFTGAQPGWWAALAMAAALLLDTATYPAASDDHRYIAAALALTASVVYAMVGDVDPRWWAQATFIAAGGTVITYPNPDVYHRFRLGLIIAGLPALTTAVVELIGGHRVSGPWWMYCLIAGGLVLGLALCFIRTEIRFPTDHANHPISSTRVDAARCLMVTVAIFSWASETHRGFTEALEPIAVLWAVFWLVGLREWSSRLRSGIGKKRS